MANVSSAANNFRFEPISWKSYNVIKKKAMEQEFSWSGLLISLSIAFFIVIATAQGLRLVYDYTRGIESYLPFTHYRLYKLENIKLNKEFIQDKLIDQEKIEKVSLNNVLC